MKIPLHLILGGSRSGKSRRAEEIAAAKGVPVTYVATYATAQSDPEMEERVARHRKQRPAHWTSIENRFDLKALFQEQRNSLILVDCLTLWLSYRQMTGASEDVILAELEEAVQSISPESPGLIVVSNETGLGLVPSSPEGRSFRDLAGRANQLVARLSSRVEFMVAGLPMLLKGDKP
jgi:adenosylcobinamide kinase / adenosylcobinamide-phosphate guanylyltransferase